MDLGLRPRQLKSVSQRPKWEPALTSDVLLRPQGAQALARLGDKLTLPVLASLAQKETDPTAQLFQIYVIGGPQAIELLHQLHQYATQTNNPTLKEQTEEARTS